MIRIPSNRTPVHPGEILLEEFLDPMGLTQRELAGAIQVPYQRVNQIVNGRRGITPSTALRLAKFFIIRLTRVSLSHLRPAIICIFGRDRPRQNAFGAPVVSYN